MDNKKQLLQQYHQGQLDAQGQQQLEDWIASGVIQLEELEAFEDTLSFLEQAETLPVSATQDQRFYQQLEREKAQLQNKGTWSNLFSKWLNPSWQIAFSLAAAVLIFWGGWQLGGEKTASVKPSSSSNIAASLLSTEDVSEKIHLVSSAQINDETDKKIIEALLFTLSNDESNNVRLACIDVLMNYSYLPIVRAGLVSSISNQNSPVVLANLAEAISASGQKMELNDIHSRINKDLPPPIQKSLEEVLIQL